MQKTKTLLDESAAKEKLHKSLLDSDHPDFGNIFIFPSNFFNTRCKLKNGPTLCPSYPFKTIFLGNNHNL